MKLDFKKFFLDLISFGSPIARLIDFSGILIILRILPTSVLSQLPTKCIFKTYILPIIFYGHCPGSGFFAYCNCPACGITRGMSRLLHGDLQGALNYNKIVPVVFIAIILYIIVDLIRIIKKRH